MCASFLRGMPASTVVHVIKWGPFVFSSYPQIVTFVINGSPVSVRSEKSAEN